MAENSGIEWTHHTFNPWMGCTKVSPACKFCYAERDMDHRYGRVAWGAAGTRVVTSKANWRKPVQWDREAKQQGIRYRVFCASLADVFEDWTANMSNTDGQLVSSTMQDIRLNLFRLIDATPNLDWLLLTKRPENIRRMWEPFDWQAVGDMPARSNVWLGTSVETSQYLGRIDSLKAAHGLCQNLFLSMEPLLGNVSTLGEYIDGIDWVITGGESGPEARPTNPDWFRCVRDQCATHDVPFFFKQWGEFDCNGEWVGKKNAGRILDGVLHDSYPKPLDTESTGKGE